MRMIADFHRYDIENKRRLYDWKGNRRCEIKDFDYGKDNNGNAEPEYGRCGNNGHGEHGGCDAVLLR